MSADEVNYASIIMESDGNNVPSFSETQDYYNVEKDNEEVSSRSSEEYYASPNKGKYTKFS